MLAEDPSLRARAQEAAVYVERVVADVNELGPETQRAELAALAPDPPEEPRGDARLRAPHPGRRRDDRDVEGDARRGVRRGRSGRAAQDGHGTSESRVPGPRLVPRRGAGTPARRHAVPRMADARVLMGRRRRVARRDARPAGEGPRDGGPHGDPNLGHPPGRTPPAVRALRDLAVQGPRALEVAVPEGDRGGPPDRDR